TNAATLAPSSASNSTRRRRMRWSLVRTTHPRRPTSPSHSWSGVEASKWSWRSSTRAPCFRSASGTSVEPRQASRNRTGSGSGRAKPLPHQVLDRVALDTVVGGEVLHRIPGPVAVEDHVDGHSGGREHRLAERDPRVDRHEP